MTYLSNHVLIGKWGAGVTWERFPVDLEHEEFLSLHETVSHYNPSSGNDYRTWTSRATKSALGDGESGR